MGWIQDPRYGIREKLIRIRIEGSKNTGSFPRSISETLVIRIFPI
jgi:hypothetical protein